MREEFWYWLLRNIEHGTVLPWWARVSRVVFFPLDALYWQMTKSRGYQLRTDTWKIYGVTYNDPIFRALSRAQGDLYRVTRVGDTVQFEYIKEDD